MRNLFYIIILMPISLFSQINITENQLFNDYFGEEEHELANRKADRLVEEGNHQEKITANLIKCGYTLYKYDTKEALQYLNKARALLDIEEDPVNLYMYFYSKGIYNMYLNKSFEQLKNFVEAVKIKKKYDIIDPLFVVESGLMQYYMKIKNYSKVFSMSNSILKQLEVNKTKYSAIKSSLFRLKAIASRNVKKYDDSKRFLDSAMLYAKYYNDSTQIARGIKYQADLLLDLKQYDKALEIALKAKALFERHDHKNMAVIYSLLGFIAFEQKQYDKSKMYLKKAIDYDAYSLYEYIKTSQYYRAILEREGETEKAYWYLRKEDSIRNVISGKDIDNKILGLELNYQEFQNHAILEKSENRIKWIAYILIFSLIGVSLLSILLYRRHKDIKKLKKTQKEIKDTNKKLKKVNFKLEKFGKIISHDLKSPIRSIGSLVTFILEDEPNLSENSKKYINLILDSVVSTENLILNLLTLARAENNSFERSKVSFNQIIQQVKANVLYDTGKSNTKIHVIRKPQFIYGNKILLIQLFQNFIQNAIQYRDKSQPLIIEIDYHEEEHKITLQNNASKINPDNLDKLFKAYNQESLESVDQDMGLGLYITKTVANFHEININITTQEQSKIIINLYFQEQHIQ
ncbi:MAG: ATP-binding protein [Flavobacteriales bacterium]